LVARPGVTDAVIADRLYRALRPSECAKVVRHELMELETRRLVQRDPGPPVRWSPSLLAAEGLHVGRVSMGWPGSF